MSQPDPFNEGPEAARARRTRSLMIALALVGFVALTFAITLIKLRHHGGL